MSISMSMSLPPCPKRWSLRSHSIPFPLSLKDSHWLPSSSQPDFISFQNSNNHSRATAIIHPSSLTRLENLEAVKLPVRLVEGRSVVGNKVCTGAGTGVLLGVEFIRSGPVSAQVDVGDDALVAEVVPNIAVRVGEISQHRPVRRLGRVG